MTPIKIKSYLQGTIFRGQKSGYKIEMVSDVFDHRLWLRGGYPPKFDPYGPEGEPDNRHKTGPQGTPWAYTY